MSIGATALAREAWRRFETVHGPVYFTSPMREAGQALGLKGYWMAYFAFRLAPLGTIGPAAATAVCYNFHPRRVARALPDAWAITTPAQALEARLDAAATALRSAVGGRVDDVPVERAADLTWAVAAEAESAGRPLGAANQALPRPDDPYARLWQATTTLRELRGDGHNAVLLANRVGPAEAHLVKAAAGEADGATLKAGRQWEDEEWEDARASLVERGWLGADGSLTPAGVSAHARIERETDEAASGPWRSPEAGEVVAALEPIARAVRDSGVLPSPNPVGMV